VVHRLRLVRVGGAEHSDEAATTLLESTSGACLPQQVRRSIDIAAVEQPSPVRAVRRLSEISALQPGMHRLLRSPELLSRVARRHRRAQQPTKQLDRTQPMLPVVVRRTLNHVGEVKTINHHGFVLARLDEIVKSLL
jgi:hypothetical protein